MPLMDLSETVEAFSETFPYKPGVAGSVSGGVWQPGARTPTTILACIQPLTGEDVQRLPEALRVDQVLVAYSKARLRGVDEVSGASADHVEVDGIDYEVQSSEPWGRLGNYYRALLRRVDP